MKEYEKCLGDTSWASDIPIKINDIITLKTAVLPKYRLERKGIDIPPPLQKSLQQLKNIYDTVLNKKLSVYQSEMDRNQKYIQPKAYLSTVLSLQVFRFYPDIHAILLNEIHLQLKPVTKEEDQKHYKKLVDLTIKSIPADLYQQLLKITTELTADKFKLLNQRGSQILAGSIEDSYRSQYDVVNFLLWAE